MDVQEAATMNVVRRKQSVNVMLYRMFGRREGSDMVGGVGGVVEGVGVGLGVARLGGVGREGRGGKEREARDVF